MAQTNDADAKLDDKIANAQMVNFVLSGIAVVAALCMWMGGPALQVPSEIVLALLPVVLICLVNNKPLLYAVGTRRRDPLEQRTDLIFAFFVCVASLAFGNQDVHFLGTEMQLEYALLGGLLGCLVIYSAARQNPQVWSAMFGMLLCAGSYGWGLARVVDSLPDKSPPAHYTTTVTNKYETYHRGTSYHLALAPWGPAQWSDSLTVSQAVYDSTLIGGQACLELYPGLLHLPWYRMVACDSTGQQPVTGDQ